MTVLFSRKFLKLDRGDDAEAPVSMNCEGTDTAGHIEGRWFRHGVNSCRIARLLIGGPKIVHSIYFTPFEVH